MTFTIKLTDDQEASLAEAVAIRLAELNTYTKPLTVSEFAKQTRQTPATVYRHIQAGNINTVPGIHKKLIPASELNAYQ